MKAWVAILALVLVVLVSGCTSFSLTDETVNLPNNSYDTFIGVLDIGECNLLFQAEYPNEDSFDCWLTEVDLQSKTFDCKCEIGGFL